MLKRETPAQVAILRDNPRTYLSLAAATGLMQLTTVLTFGMLQVGYSLALFQMSTLISVFLGYRYFHETNIRSRLFGSVVMVAGAVLIVEFGAGQ
jgi:drug/metabolite transporter (DMT)-like permease